jgi:predicted solute-binding protein
MSKEDKSTAVKIEERMARVFEMMLYEHLSYNEFKEKAAKEFNITARMAENYWKEARVRLKERFERNSEEILQDHLNQLYDLLKRSRDDNNKRTEREVLADIAKIMGLEATKKIDLTSNGQTIAININVTE